MMKSEVSRTRYRARKGDGEYGGIKMGTLLLALKIVRKLERLRRMLVARHDDSILTMHDILVQ